MDVGRKMGANLSKLKDCLERIEVDAGQLLNRFPREVHHEDGPGHLKIGFELSWWSKEATADGSGDTPHGIRPDQVRPRDVYGLEVTVKFAATFAPEAVDSDALCDPFKEFSVDIVLRSLADHGDCYYAWHIDREGREVRPWKSGAPKALHPCYHVQAGGNRLMETLDPLDVSEPSHRPYGRVLLIDAPRIAVPPMDPVLAIDFAFSHFDGDSWRKLRGMPEYRDIVRMSQMRYWRRYYLSLYRHFSGEDTEWDPAVVHPGLMPTEWRMTP